MISPTWGRRCRYYFMGLEFARKLPVVFLVKFLMLIEIDESFLVKCGVSDIKSIIIMIIFFIGNKANYTSETKREN